MVSKDFVEKAINEGEGVIELGEAISKCCFENEEISRRIAKTFLKGLNGTNYERSRYYMKAIKPFILLKDKFQPSRIAWLLGHSNLVTSRFNTSQVPPTNELPKVGLSMAKSLNDDVYTWLTGIQYKAGQDSPILKLICRYKGRMDMLTLSYIEGLVEYALEDETVLEYLYK